MSKSKAGTKSTSAHINNSSLKYVQRSDHGFSKRGSTSSATDGAHIMSYGLYNTIATNTQGRPLSSKGQRELHRDLNHDTNIRLKTQHGNRVLDERRDARIAHAFVSGEPIQGKSTANRAFQAYQSASTFTTLSAASAQLGDMKVHNPDTGRFHMLKNHGNHTK